MMISWQLSFPVAPAQTISSEMRPECKHAFLIFFSDEDGFAMNENSREQIWNDTRLQIKNVSVDKKCKSLSFLDKKYKTKLSACINIFLLDLNCLDKKYKT